MCGNETMNNHLRVCIFSWAQLLQSASSKVSCLSVADLGFVEWGSGVKKNVTNVFSDPENLYGRNRLSSSLTAEFRT